MAMSFIRVKSNPPVGGVKTAYFRAGLDVKSPRALLSAVPTILVVDDEPDIRNALRRLLVARGFEVVEAGSAAEGAERAAAGGIDAILCDIVMPGGSGLDFYDALLGPRPELARRLVFLTAAAKEPEVLAQVEAREVPLLSKLYELELAVDAVAVALLQK